MTRERISAWQTAIVWLIGTLVVVGIAYGVQTTRIQALERERDDWKAAVQELKVKIDKIDTTLGEIKESLPLFRDHLDKDRILKPSDLLVPRDSIK